jgi:phosphoribosylamine-glycine ligase
MTQTNIRQLETQAATFAAVQVTSWCKQNQIGLVAIGPEQPLVDGLADALEAADIR